MLHERPTVPFGFIVEEHVFRRRLGGAEMQRSKLDLVLSGPRNVTLQVVPMEAEFHGCLDRPVRLLEAPDGRRLGYSER
ncbi:Scr1 family TA system antitoxin-like transcriptional regulator [Streptomyces sp. R44]|uniref:Scr1 family TA system antitoxin-like transcriptional regulator n=1 Tax=Streptomyces sp. R44 TaxID=3238633 RepID=A0AB39SM91_9ACTN